MLYYKLMGKKKKRQSNELFRSRPRAKLRRLVYLLPRGPFPSSYATGFDDHEVHAHFNLYTSPPRERTFTIIWTSTSVLFLMI